MAFDGLNYGDSFTEKMLQDTFSVRNSGGIRPSLKNKVIILIDSAFTTNTGQGNYQNVIDEKNGTVHYIGEGEGRQQMVRNNRCIMESKSRGFRLLYFKKRIPNHLVFQFEVEYVSFSRDVQRNSNGIQREIIKFKLWIL